MNTIQLKTSLPASTRVALSLEEARAALAFFRGTRNSNSWRRRYSAEEDQQYSRLYLKTRHELAAIKRGAAKSSGQDRVALKALFLALRQGFWRLVPTLLKHAQPTWPQFEKIALIAERARGDGRIIGRLPGWKKLFVNGERWAE